MRRRTEELDDGIDDLVHRRFVRVIGLPHDTAPAPGPTDERPDQDPVGPTPTPTPASVWTPALTDPDSADSFAELPSADRSLRRGRAVRAVAALDPGRRGVRALALVAVIVVLAAGFVAWHSRPQPVTVQTRGVAAAPTVGPVTDSAPASAAVLVVAVAGRVRQPGLVRLPAGARVADALDAAGGVLPGTDLAYVNLARKVTDGELLLIGVTPPPGMTGVLQGGPDGTGAAAAGPVNLNTATVAQLQTLPGVGPVLAQRIIDFRTEHGGFRRVDDLRQVDGIGDARFKQLKPLVTV